MEIEIQKQKETPLLSRKRISALVTYEGSTPSRLELVKGLAAKVKAKPELMVIRHIYPRFGLAKAKVIVHQYNDHKTMVLLEGQALVDKHKEKGSEAAEDGQASADAPSKARHAAAEPAHETEGSGKEEKSKQADPKESKIDTKEAPDGKEKEKAKTDEQGSE